MKQQNALLAHAHLVRGLAPLLRKHDADLAAVDPPAVQVVPRVVGLAVVLELDERKALRLAVMQYVSQPE